MSESKKAIDALKALSLQAAVPTDTLATALAELSGLAATAAQLEAVSLSSALRSDDLIDNFAEATKRQHDELLRAALGPFEDLKKRLLIETRLVPQIDMSAFSTQMEALNASFRLPALSEWKDLTSEALLASALTTDMSLSSAIQEAMGQMETPWLDTANAFSSARGFGDLQILGVSLDESPPFDDQLTEQLRTALGDWRTAQLEIPRIEADLNARTRFYHEQGLDFALSAFPAPAFDQATKIARIQQPPTTLIVLYDYVIPARSREEAAEFKRTNEAHDRLQRFETRFRAFIEARLKEKFGPRWVKERDPQTLMPRGKRRPSERKILATSLDL